MTELSNHPLTESLSALADGEATPLEVRRLLKASEADAELGSRWGRYHLASAVMRRDVGAMAPKGFAASVSAALDEEPTIKARSGQWWQHLGRTAVAASVAGVVLIGVQQYPGAPGGAEVASGPAAEQSAPASGPGNGGASEPVSLPAGYQAPSFPAARTASAQSGYEPGQRRSREVIFVPVQSDAVQIPAEEIRAYLNQLMQEHSDHAARNSNQGVLPYARVSTDEDN